MKATRTKTYDIVRYVAKAKHQKHHARRTNHCRLPCLPSNIKQTAVTIQPKAGTSVLQMMRQCGMQTTRKFMNILELVASHPKPSPFLIILFLPSILLLFMESKLHIWLPLQITRGVIHRQFFGVKASCLISPTLVHFPSPASNSSEKLSRVPLHWCTFLATRELHARDCVCISSCALLSLLALASRVQRSHMAHLGIHLQANQQQSSHGDVLHLLLLRVQNVSSLEENKTWSFCHLELQRKQSHSSLKSALEELESAFSWQRFCGAFQALMGTQQSKGRICRHCSSLVSSLLLESSRLALRAEQMNKQNFSLLWLQLAEELLLFWVALCSVSAVLLHALRLCLQWDLHGIVVMFILSYLS